MQGQINLIPLRIIRIAKDLSIKEMANYFMVTKAYISAIEKNNRKMRIQTLKFGLDNMGISLDDYSQLEKFNQELLSSELDDRDKFKFMLIKALGVIDNELKFQSEYLLQEHYYKKIEVKKTRNL